MLFGYNTVITTDNVVLLIMPQAHQYFQQAMCNVHAS